MYIYICTTQTNTINLLKFQAMHLAAIVLAPITYALSQPKGCVTCLPEVAMLTTVHEEQTIAIKAVKFSGLALSIAAMHNLDGLQFCFQKIMGI